MADMISRLYPALLIILYARIPKVFLCIFYAFREWVTREYVLYEWWEDFLPYYSVGRTDRNH